MGNKSSSSHTTSYNLVQKQLNKPKTVNNSHLTLGAQPILNGNYNQVTFENITVGQSHSSVITEGIELQIMEPVTSFHGRSKELHNLKAAFNKTQGSRRFKMVVLCGIGGAGKTECARAYVHRHRLEFSNLIWLHCETISVINKSFEKLFAKMNLPQNSDAQDIYAYFNNQKTLFIFDNSEDLRSIQRFLPEKNNQSLFLVTSQIKNWNPFEAIELGELLEPDAVDVLTSALLVHAIQVESKILEELVCNIGSIPLVLHISAGYICQQILDFNSVDRNYDIQDVIKKFLNGGSIVTESFPSFYLNPYSKSVYTAVNRTLIRIWNKTDPVALIASDMLGLAAYLNPEEINSNIFNVILKVEDGMLLGKAFALLVNYSLFQKETITEFRIHRNVQECLRYHYTENKINKHFSKALQLLLSNSFNWHFNAITDHAEKNLDALCKFYLEYSSRQLHETLAEYGSCTLIFDLVNSTNLIQCPEFLWAVAKYKRDDLAQMLLLRGADINVKDHRGFTALHHTCLEPYGWKFVHVIKYLISLGATVNVQNNTGNNLLHTVCEVGTDNEDDIFWAAAVLLLHGVDPRIGNINNKSAVDVARQFGLNLVVQLLNSVAPEGQDVPQIVIKCRQFQCFENLLYNDLIKVNSQDDTGCTVLHTLCGLDTTEDELFDITTELVWLYSANVCIKNSKDQTAADVAQSQGYKALADLLDPTKPTGPRALLVAAKHNKLHLLTMWKYIAYQDEAGCTALHVLCDMDDIEASDANLISIIIETGLIRIRNKRNNEGLRPDQIARLRGRRKLAAWLEKDTQPGSAKRNKYLITTSFNTASKKIPDREMPCQLDLKAAFELDERLYDG